MSRRISPSKAALTHDPLQGSFPVRWFGCSIPVLLIYVCFSVVLSVVAFMRPLPTFDRYLYAGAVASLRYTDPATIHRIARAEFDAQPSPFNFNNVADEPYFVDVHDNPFHFAQQMGLFRVKFAYVVAGYTLWRAGLPILVGLRLISAGCLFVVAISVLAWTHDVLLSCVLLLTPPVLNMGRLVTADPLSTVIIFLGLFAFANRRVSLSICLILASILVRTDNSVLALILFVWMVWNRQIRRSVGGISIGLSALTAFLINHVAGLYQWRVVMQHGFIKPEVDPLTHPVKIDFGGYLHTLAGLRGIPYTSMTVFLLVALVAWKLLPQSSILRKLLPVVGFSIAIRLIIFPNFDDRYFVWAYLLAAVALIHTYRSRGTGKERSPHARSV
jgi:hypothetical protein